MGQAEQGSPWTNHSESRSQDRPGHFNCNRWRNQRGTCRLIKIPNELLCSRFENKLQKNRQLTFSPLVPVDPESPCKMNNKIRIKEL